MNDKSMEILPPISSPQTDDALEHFDPGELKPGKKAPKLRPTRDQRGIRLNSLKNIRLEMSKLHRLWCANEITSEDYKLGMVNLERIAKVRAAEVAEEEAGRFDDDDKKPGKFGGLQMIMAVPSERKKK